MTVIFGNRIERTAENGFDKRFAQCAERERSQCDAELKSRKILVEIRENFEQTFCRTVAFFGERFDARAAHAHKSKLRRDKKTVERNQT